MRSSLLQLRLFIFCVVLGPWLAGCVLMSDRAEQRTITPTNGNQRISFYSSDSNCEAAEQVLEIDTTAARVDVTFSARVEVGELRIEVLNGDDGNVAFTLEGTKDGASASGIVRTNDVGDLRYRLFTRNARNGEYSIRYIPPPTPTPTPSPTTTPQPTNTSTPSPTATATDTPTSAPTVDLTATP